MRCGGPVRAGVGPPVHVAVRNPAYRRADEDRLPTRRPRHRQPTTSRLLIATAVALVGSLLADVVLVAIGKALLPWAKSYPHFQFADYAKLTVVGVVIACAAWPVVTRITSSPRWLFLRLAVLVTAVLLLPDVWLLVKGQPAKAVGVLVLMHFAIALVTYNALVRIAPVKSLRLRSAAQV